MDSGVSSMNGREFVRRARRYARRTGQDFRFNSSRGKGSHGALYIGRQRTIVKRGEISKGMLSAMLRQLGIDSREF